MHTQVHKVAKKFNKNYPTIAASTPCLANWCPDKDNSTSQKPGKHDEKYVQLKCEFNRATTTREIKQNHSTHKTKIKNKNKNNHHIIHTINNLNCTQQLYTHHTKTQTLSSTSHASSAKHTTKSVTDIADNKTVRAQNTNIKTTFLKYIKEEQEKIRLFRLKEAEAQEQHKLKMEEYEKERKEKDWLH